MMKPEQNPRQTTSPVRLHIDRLVLHGFAAADRYHIADRMQSELARLMREDPALASLQRPMTIDRADAGSIRIHPGANPGATGTLIAQAIHQSLRRGTAPSPTRAGTGPTTSFSTGRRKP